MKKLLLVFFTISILGACKKEEGEGGLASVRGTIQTDIRLVPSNPVTLQYSRPGVDVEVYIIYGDNVGPDDRVWTNYKGEFEFRNLRPGDYKVYVYSRDTTGAAQVNAERMPIVKEFKIEERKDEVNLGTITIYDVP